MWSRRQASQGSRPGLFYREEPSLHPAFRDVTTEGAAEGTKPFGPRLTTVIASPPP